eukprot:1215206-Prymnesium_polylepis.1
MASFVRSAPPRRTEWSLEDAERFAALKEFKLLQLLSTDKNALATARRLGFLFGHTQTQPHCAFSCSSCGWCGCAASD